MTKIIDQSHRGAKTVVSYTFPAHRIEIAKGDFVDLKISVLNSYDGSWRFMSLVGAVRLACTNGQVIGDYFSSFYGKHTKSLDTDVAVKKLETALDVYTKNAELWKQYPSSKVTKPQAKKIFESMSGKNKKMLEFLEETHLQYIDEMGHNLWALFNTLTHWSSHAKFKNEANKSATIINRENKVRKVLPMLNDLLKVA